VKDWIERCLGHEGAYWDDPVGGPTKYGISQRSYPDLDIASLTIDDARAIYRRDFVKPLNLDTYPPGVAFQLFDFAVNSGPKTAIKQLQEALGLKPDGVVGPKTKAALAGKTDSDLVMLVIAERLDFMASLRNFIPNAKGWVRRMAANLRHGAEDTD
jgi:lysozyme family protein